MTDQFTHGYALLIGVGESAYPGWSLPATVKDVQALKKILTDPNLCAYPDDEQHIRLLHDSGATKSAILSGLVWLQAQAAADPEATVVVYFSGHGWLSKATGQYYLIPHDLDPFDFPESALPAQTFGDAVRQIEAWQLLVFIDSCHAEGMAASKDQPALKLPKGFAQAALPEGLSADLKQGKGRTIFASSRGAQPSWVRKDKTMSIYTYHLIEAFHGAGNQPGDHVVRVSNLMNHLGKAVPASALQMYQAEQTPFFDYATEDFAVAVLRGGKGLPAGGWAAVQHEAAATIQQITHVEASGDRSIAIGGEVSGGMVSSGDIYHGRSSGPLAQGPGAAAASGGGIAVGGEMQGDIIQAEAGGVAQKGKYNIHMERAEGVVIGDHSRVVQTIGGDVRDSTVVAAGGDAHVTSGATPDQIRALFEPILKQIQERPADPDVDKEEIAQNVASIRDEVTQGEQANPRRIERWIKFLAEMAPDIRDVVVATLLSPAAGIAEVVRKVAQQAKPLAGG